MNRYTKILLTLAIACITTNACKLDKHVVPAAGNTDPTDGQTVLGIIVKGKTLNDSYLNALWKATSTAQQLYDTAYIVLSGVSVPNKFSAVKLDDQAKTAVYTNLPASAGPSTVTYKLSTSNNVLYIKLTPNPFFTSTTSEVRITNLTSTSMTWVALDTVSTLLGGKYLHKGYQVTFTK